MGFFGAAHGWGEGPFWPPLSKICHTYPTMMKLGIVVPYLGKTQKLYKSRDTSLDFCSHQHFFYQESANFPTSRNTGIDWILIHNL